MYHNDTSGGPALTDLKAIAVCPLGHRLDRTVHQDGCPYASCHYARACLVAPMGKQHPEEGRDLAC